MKQFCTKCVQENETEMGGKNVDVINITTPTIKVFVAPAPTKARTISKVDIGAAKIS